MSEIQSADSHEPKFWECLFTAINLQGLKFVPLITSPSFECEHRSRLASLKHYRCSFLGLGEAAVLMGKSQPPGLFMIRVIMTM